MKKFYLHSLLQHLSQTDPISFRYTFNGMESDDELKGENNSYNFGARMYDPRTARWSKMDPKWSKTAGITPYRYGFNSPVVYNDPDGNFERRTTTYKDQSGKIILTVVSVDYSMVKRGKEYATYGLGYSPFGKAVGYYDYDITEEFQWNGNDFQRMSYNSERTGNLMRESDFVTFYSHNPEYRKIPTVKGATYEFGILFSWGNGMSIDRAKRVTSMDPALFTALEYTLKATKWRDNPPINIDGIKRQDPKALLELAKFLAEEYESIDDAYSRINRIENYESISIKDWIKIKTQDFGNNNSYTVRNWGDLSISGSGYYADNGSNNGYKLSEDGSFIYSDSNIIMIPEGKKAVQKNTGSSSDVWLLENK